MSSNRLPGTAGAKPAETPPERYARLSGVLGRLRHYGICTEAGAGGRMQKFLCRLWDGMTPAEREQARRLLKGPQ